MFESPIKVKEGTGLYAGRWVVVHDDGRHLWDSATQALAEKHAVQIRGHARLRAKADRESAERQTGARVSATRYSADQGVAAAKVRTKGAGKDDRTKAFSDLHDEVRKTVGKQAMGAFGGTKMADEDTLNMARYAEALMDNDESLGSGDAISKAVAEFKKRKPTTTDAEE